MAQEKVALARDIMIRNPVTVQPEDDIEMAVRLIFRRGYSGLPVVDDDGRLRGILSEHDCIRVMAEAIMERWPVGRVDAHMTCDLDTADPTEDVLVLAARFARGTLRRLLVVEDDRLVGLITERDLLKELNRMEQAMDHPRRKTTYEEIARRWGSER